MSYSEIRSAGIGQRPHRKPLHRKPQFRHMREQVVHLGNRHLQVQLSARARNDTERQSALDQLQDGLRRATHVVEQLLILARQEPEVLERVQAGLLAERGVPCETFQNFDDVIRALSLDGAGSGAAGVPPGAEGPPGAARAGEAG